MFTSVQVFKMANILGISAPTCFNAKGDPNSLGSRWTKWVYGFKTYIAAAGVTDDNQKRALLLHCSGESVQEVSDTLPNTGESFDEALVALDAYFKPKQNKHFERHVTASESFSSSMMNTALLSRNVIRNH